MDKLRKIRAALDGTFDNAAKIKPDGRKHPPMFGYADDSEIHRRRVMRMNSLRRRTKRRGVSFRERALTARRFNEDASGGHMGRNYNAQADINC